MIPLAEEGNHVIISQSNDREKVRAAVSSPSSVIYANVASPEGFEPTTLRLEGSRLAKRSSSFGINRSQI